VNKAANLFSDSPGLLSEALTASNENETLTSQEPNYIKRIIIHKPLAGSLNTVRLKCRQNFFDMAAGTLRLYVGTYQDCQIFLGTTYQNIPKAVNILKSSKIYQIAELFTKSS
jgi:hypothetical protein